MTEIRRTWQRIKKWATDNGPELLEYLNPGASADQLAELQQQLGLQLPDEFLDSLRLHDGERDLRGQLFVDMGALLPCDQIIERWQLSIAAAEDHEEIDEEEAKELIAEQIMFVDGPVRPLSFHHAWVPVLDMNGDVLWALDFAPPQDGTPGQMIRVDLESLDWRVVAPSFGAFLDAFAEALETDDLGFSKGASFNAALGANVLTGPEDDE